MSTIPTPASINERYRISSRLGESRVATVYRADDLRLHRTILVHLLREPQLTQAQLLQRQNIASRGLLSVYDSGTLHGRPFILTEDVSGQALADAAPLAPEQALAVVRTVIDTVVDAQTHHVPHPAINGRNVWLMEHGRVVLLEDWCLPPTALAQIDAPYRAPATQHGAPPSAASTVYALGVLLRHALTGTPDKQQNRHGMHGSVQLTQIVERATAPAPHQRYTTPHEFAQALDQYAANLGAQTTFVPVAQAAPPPVQRPPVWQRVQPAKVPPPRQTKVMASPPPPIATPAPDAPVSAAPHTAQPTWQRSQRKLLPDRWRRSMIRGGLRLARALAILAVLFWGANYVYNEVTSRARQLDPAAWVREQVPEIDVGAWLEQNTPDLPDINIGEWVQRQVSDFGADLGEQVRDIGTGGTTYLVTQPINLRSEPSANDDGTVIQPLAVGTRLRQEGAPRDDPNGGSYQWVRVVLDDGSQREGWVALLNNHLEQE